MDVVISRPENLTRALTTSPLTAAIAMNLDTTSSNVG